MAQDSSGDEDEDIESPFPTVIPVDVAGTVVDLPPVQVRRVVLVDLRENGSSTEIDIENPDDLPLQHTTRK